MDLLVKAKPAVVCNKTFGSLDVTPHPPTLSPQPEKAIYIDSDLGLPFQAGWGIISVRVGIMQKQSNFSVAGRIGEVKG